MSLTVQESLEAYKNDAQKTVVYHTETVLKFSVNLKRYCKEWADELWTNQQATYNEIFENVSSDLENIKIWLKSQKKWENKHKALTDAMEKVLA